MDANMINLTDAFKDYETAARVLKIQLLFLTFFYLGFIRKWKAVRSTERR